MSSEESIPQNNPEVLQSLLQAVTAVAQNTAPVQSSEKSPQAIVAELEARVEAMHGEFSWDLHNELRHHYLAIDARESRRHADIILQHAFMDSYTLNTLSGWHFTSGAIDRGIAQLNHVIELYDQYPYVQAACLIHLGDAYLDQRNISLATNAFQRVLEIDVPSVAPYRELAEKRLNS